MPSSKIIPSCAQIVQEQLLPQIPVRWQRQFKFGIHALSLKPFASLASNARQSVSHPDTASTKIDRLTHNEPLAEAIGAAVAGLGFVRPTSVVALDHSDFSGLMAFVGAVQTRKGRAVPCLVATTYSPRTYAHATAPRQRQIRAAYKQLDYHLYDQARTTLEAWAAQLGFWPRLVFDRGFGSMPLIRCLVEHQATFYIRMKAGRIIELGGNRLRVDQLHSNDVMVSLQDIRLRVVSSDAPEIGEPWYILTSDTASTRAQIIRTYYYRFEIEETFKDLKHILQLEQTKLMKPLSLKVLLWFVCLNLILAFLVGWWSRGEQPRHPKKRLSRYRQFFEALQHEFYKSPADLITGGLAK
jgi:hypothetical protein